MPFGFGVGDFAAVGKLAWYLYHDCFLVAKGAPQEFRLLVDELKTLHATIKLFEDEFGDPNSVLVRAGEDRLRMVEDLLAQVMHVLNGLREAYDKHRNLGNVSRTSFKRGWDQFKWAVGVKDVEGLRSKLTYLNGLLALLLTCAGNSSLQRLETTTQSIDAGVHGIKTFLKRVGTGDLPIVSAFGATNSPAKIDFSQRCMQAAKVSQRWTLIGIEEWTKAGRWWLLKAHMELRAAARATVPNDAYANLLKASWILTDVIVVHPHMIYIEASVQCDVLRLTEAIKEEFQYIEDKNLRIPSLEDVDDPEIWESQLTSPAMRPGSIAGERTWVMKDEDIIFQRFARYQASYQQIPIPSLVLLLVDKKSRKPRLVVHDQSWRCLAELAAELFPTLKPRHDNIVSIAGVQIILSTTFDAQLLGAFLLGYGLHIIRCTPDFQHSMQVNHDAIFLLAAMMISTVDIVEYFLGIL
ncbi:hypothetical protein BZA05DRAFT_429113, partial [Tricharina praecox]|uniref:uncharacterized protein n=1 Tax=Tricharina praecox TaxID=43433 RepID=UPI00221FB93B